MHIKFRQQHCNVCMYMYRALKPYTLARFEPGFFCSVGRRDDNYATSPGQWILLIDIIIITYVDHAARVVIVGVLDISTLI
jgi:hypothetical protein